MMVVEGLLPRQWEKVPLTLSEARGNGADEGHAITP
jgi:hypothetical protein